MSQYSQHQHHHHHGHRNGAGQSTDGGKKSFVKPIIIAVAVLLSVAFIVWGVLFLTRDLRKPPTQVDNPTDITELPTDDLSDL